MDEGFGVLGSVDNDGEGFITPLDSTPIYDTVQVWEDPADLYTVIHASGINMCF